MIQTFKIKHGEDYSHELMLARKVAKHSLKNKSISSKDVKHIGLKSMISNQILRKYSRNKKLKRINSVKLTIPNQGIKVIDDNSKIYIPCLKLNLDIYFNNTFDKINQIEIDDTYAYVSATYKEKPLIEPKSFMGVDMNTMKHVAVASNPITGKVLKMGKSCNHIHNKYKYIRKSLQKKGKFKRLKQMKKRESRIIKNINHHISKKVVKEAVKNKSGIVLEKLTGIRKMFRKKSYNVKKKEGKNKYYSKKLRYSLNSWSFYQLRQMIEYKSKKLGIPVYYIEPSYTSQQCGRCGHIDKDNRKGKLFQCKSCGIVENADVNAGFNIALKHQCISQFNIESDVLKGRTDTPKVAMGLNPT